jgi:superfamily II DNA/RNA helicase
MSFKKLNLNAKLLQAIDYCGFIAPTPIQERAIPIIMRGHDLMASAQTGTGKTAAFAAPMLDRLQNIKKRTGIGPLALILTPTRELAEQINRDIKKLGRFCNLTTISLLGGVAYQPQIKSLRSRVDIIVATPGRLLDHMRAGRLDFSQIQMLVLDEADRMLDMGFIGDVTKIAKETPSKRQTLLFSATLEAGVLSIAKRLMREPQRLQLAVNTQRHALIEQHFFQADTRSHKHQLLAHHLSNQSINQALIFTSTKRNTDSLARSLSANGHPSAALHGDMSQHARRKTIAKMRSGQLRLLVATDVAARGLDIKGISHVFNYDLPHSAGDYVHRIGRTGRAGSKGAAISLVGPDDWTKLAGIERLTGQRFDREVVVGLEPLRREPKMGFGAAGRSWKPSGIKRSRLKRRSRMRRLISS